jgi:hypothetical protein
MENRYFPRKAFIFILIELSYWVKSIPPNNLFFLPICFEMSEGLMTRKSKIFIVDMLGSQIKLVLDTCPRFPGQYFSHMTSHKPDFDLSFAVTKAGLLFDL